MKDRLSRLSEEYLAALRKHLKLGPKASSQPAIRLGRQAVVLGLETLDLAQIHILSDYETHHRPAGGRPQDRREGLRKLLEAERDLQVVGEAETGRQAVALTKKLRPAVVVMDIAMPLLNGLEATRQIRRAFPETQMLILSAHSDDVYIEQVTALGAAGYLIKQTSSHFLSEAIREVKRATPFSAPRSLSTSTIITRTRPIERDC